MRGGEGLAAAAAYAVTSDGIIINPVSCDTIVNGRKLKITSDYPHGKTIKIRFEGGGRLYLFVPSWTAGVKSEYISGCDEHYVYIDAPDNAEFTVTVNKRLWNDETRVYDGPLMLASSEPLELTDGLDVTAKNGKYTAKGKELKTLDKTYLLSQAEIESEKLFVKLI